MFAYGSFLRYSRPIFIMPTFVFDYIRFVRTHTARLLSPEYAQMYVYERARSRFFAQSEERTRISQQQQQKHHQQQQQKERTL